MLWARFHERNISSEKPAINDPDSIIAVLGLAPHPEGGWYRETWRAPGEEGTRSPGTAIHFLLKPGERSHWHRVDAEELWFWHAGDPITLSLAESDTAQPRSVTLGGDVLQGQQPQWRIPAGQWQAAAAGQGWALVSCVVVPGFDFAGFDLAPPGWSPG